jgi:GNAT superfamily N-acetyltransferase
MQAGPYLFSESRAVSPEELGALFLAVGWGPQVASRLRRSMDAYPFVIHARTTEGLLVGFLSAFSDEVTSTMLGELVVHPAHRRHGVAAELLRRLEARFPDAPVYIKALGDAKKFFLAQGYNIPRAEMTVLFKKPAGKPA